MLLGVVMMIFFPNLPILVMVLIAAGVGLLIAALEGEPEKTR
jgi:hypothetical protein